jgi:hypothetical protein
MKAKSGMHQSFVTGVPLLQGGPVDWEMFNKNIEKAAEEREKRAIKVRVDTVFGCVRIYALIILHVRMFMNTPQSEK